MDEGLVEGPGSRTVCLSVPRGAERPVSSSPAPGLHVMARLARPVGGFAPRAPRCFYRALDPQGEGDAPHGAIAETRFDPVATRHAGAGFALKAVCGWLAYPISYAIRLTGPKPTSGVAPPSRLAVSVNSYCLPRIVMAKPTQ